MCFVSVSSEPLTSRVHITLPLCPSCHHYAFGCRPYYVPAALPPPHACLMRLLPPSQARHSLCCRSRLFCPQLAALGSMQLSGRAGLYLPLYRPLEQLWRPLPQLWRRLMQGGRPDFLFRPLALITHCCYNCGCIGTYTRATAFAWACFPSCSRSAKSIWRTLYPALRSSCV